MKRQFALALTALFAVAAVGLVAVNHAHAGDKHDHKEHKTKAKVGHAAPGFTLTDVSTGEDVSLSDFEGQIVVLTWQSVTCPWDAVKDDAGYGRVLYPMAEKYKDQGVVFLAINSNKNESVEKIAKFAEKHSTPFPILKDPGNQVADIYGAKTTPHIFIKGKDGNLAYKGGIEEVPGSPAQCGQMDTQYLEPVLQALLAGNTPPVTSTTAKGCSIKRVKK